MMTDIIEMIKLKHPSAVDDVLKAERKLYDEQDYLVSTLRNDDAFNDYSEEVLWGCVKEITNN